MEEEEASNSFQKDDSSFDIEGEEGYSAEGNCIRRGVEAAWHSVPGPARAPVRCGWSVRYSHAESRQQGCKGHQSQKEKSRWPR